MELERGRHYVPEILKNALKLDGDLIDLGVANGEQTILLAEEIKKAGVNKKLYACDTWEGNPYTDQGTPVRSDLRKGEFSGNKIEDFKRKCKERNVDDIIIPIVGKFEATLQEELADMKFCYAFLDANLYISTRTAYEFLEDRMVKNGIVGFHDYEFHRCPGVTHVVNKEIDKQKYKMLYRQRMHIFFQKQKNVEEKKPVEKKETKPKEKKD